MTQIETTEAGMEIHTFDFDSDASATEMPDVFVTDRFTDGYGTDRAALDGDTFDAKDAIKFDWNQTHHKFDGNTKQWIVDAAALDAIAEKLEDAGFTFGEFERATDGPIFDLAELAERDDHIEIEYEKKNKNGTATHTGFVRNVSYGSGCDELPTIAFTREDDRHLMYVRHDANGVVSLFTSGSAYPYIGRVTSVELHNEN